MEILENQQIPNIKLSSKSIHPFVRIGGPHYSFPDTFIAPYGSELFSSKSISTYPHNPNQIPPREGDPISDRYFCAFYENKALMAIAAGTGKGFAAVDAAEKAIIGFVEYMTSAQSEILSTAEALKSLEKAFKAAEEKIKEDKEDLSKVGSCSLLGGLLLELNVSEEYGWAFVGCSVGHCKAFLLPFRDDDDDNDDDDDENESGNNNDDNKDGKANNKEGGQRKRRSPVRIIDITENSYITRPPHDGSDDYLLGPNGKKKKIRTYFCPCNKNDVIIMMSEGAHSNFHPQQVGIGVNQMMGKSDVGNEDRKWSDMMPAIGNQKQENGEKEEGEKDDASGDSERRLISKKLNEVICSSVFQCLSSSPPPPSLLSPASKPGHGKADHSKAGHGKATNPKPTNPKPSEIVDRIINHNLKVTKEVREKMISEDLKYAQIDQSKYSAYVGHCTATAIKAIPLVASCSSSSSPSDHSLIDKINCVWQWKAFLPISASSSASSSSSSPDHDPAFDIWKFLIQQNSSLEEAINKEEETEFSECFMNVKSDDVMFYQVGNTKEELTIEISVKTKANAATRVERWETAGKFTINDKTTKRYLSSTISNLLRQKEFDRRKIKDIILNFIGMNTLKDTVEVKGLRKIVQFPQFGESMKTLSGDVTFSQSKVEIVNSVTEEPKKYLILELYSTSEKRLIQFIQKLNLTNQWMISSFPELLMQLTSS